MNMIGQLWLKSSNDFVLPGFTNRVQSSRWDAPGLRAVYWPNGRICWQLNLYLISLRRSGLKVSTVNTYASELSIFIRFLFDEKISIEEIFDDTLVSYSDWLLTRRSASRNHINRLIRCAISFLDWFQHLLVEKRLVGTLGQGCQVTIVIRTRKSRRGIARTRVQHFSMVPRSVPRTVRPVSKSIISKLLESCEWVAKTNFRRSRDRCIVVLLADSGLRREELTWLRCEQIHDAFVNGGKLRVRTSKRRGNPEREVPIPEETMRALVEFLNISRAIQMRKLRKLNPNFQDHCWAFCTRTGQKMAPTSISQLFLDLRSGAGITERVSAHMLRHRYITLQVIARLRSLNNDSTVGVEALTTVLSKVASLSGHASLESLWRYVDWSFDELQIEESDSAALNEEANKVVDRLLRDATTDSDIDLISALTLVRAALSQDGSPKTALPSVVAHSLHDQSNRT